MKDTQLFKFIAAEKKRQALTINLIPSENYVSEDIQEVLGSPLVNKYSEGYPGKRYYPGNVYYDKIENLAQERALRLFKLNPKEWAVNVQPYSGSPANLAIYQALMNFGDTLMGLRLSDGGHLTHGHSVSFSGKAYRVVHYGVDVKTERLDYRAIAALAKKHKPKVIVSGLTAYPRILDFKKFGMIARSVTAYHLADISHIAGLIAAGLHPTPFPYSDVVMTTTHKTLRGPRGAVIFSRKQPLTGRSDLTIAEAVDRSVFPGFQGGPHNNVTAAKALLFFEASQPLFRRYQRSILENAAMLAGELVKLGFRLVTGGTDNHLMLLDVRGVGLGGLQAEKILEENSITANRNAITGDTSPFLPSGLRLGTPAVTTRGMGKQEMKKIAAFIYRCLVKRESIRAEVEALCRAFPISKKWR